MPDATTPPGPTPPPAEPATPQGHQADLAALRVSYTSGALDEADLAATPLAQFRAWFDDAAASPAVVEPNAVVVATAGPTGPSVRTVLLKGLDGAGFRFYTGLGSRKARDLAADPRAALLFAWVPLQRQVSVRGPVGPLPREEVLAYFTSRPYGSRIGAWVSEQSAPVDRREVLEEREAELRRRWPDTGSPDDVPLPDHWGGFLVRAAEVELWQGRASRLHDRLVYVAREGTGRLDVAGDWRVERRQP
ncbi:pyridoxamine 5'-phosphate oxidase [Aquipuribacter hungaricus]|uniref:Pyridoxine/pyridoxamine 5'-phosphate oxidase n=1 Tax=Aquipuribacter hungaricus TaxID=545624 RepID=A0ABV7WD63_9MICO